MSRAVVGRIGSPVPQPARAPAEDPESFDLPEAGPDHAEPGADRQPNRRFAGAWQRLDRLGRVVPGTVAVVRNAGGVTELKSPGELLVPPWPFTGERRVLVVSTRPVTVRVRVEHLVTVDHEELGWVELDVDVRLVAARVVALLADDGDLEDRLRAGTEEALESGVRAAVGLNRLQDLRRQTLAGVLEDRWLPTTLVSDALVREGFRVRAVGWPSDADAEEDPVVVAELPAAPEELSLRFAPVRFRSWGPTVSVDDALALVYLPAAISLGVWWFFFVSSWLPELRSVPGAGWLLHQLAPVAPPVLAGQGAQLPAATVGHPGPGATLLLVSALLLPPLARSRQWLARLALWPLTYLAGVGALVNVIEIGVAGHLAAEFLGVALLAVWVWAAAVTTWRSLRVEVDELPRRPTRVGWLVAAFALLSPAPVAVGRALFGRDLYAAALSLSGNGLTLRWAALLTPATALLYVCAVLLAVLVWLGYLSWPPRLTGSAVRPAVAAGLVVLALLVTAPAAVKAAHQRAEVIRTQSPGHELGFRCGEWVTTPGGSPAQTLTVTGLGCRRMTAYLGYREVASSHLTNSLSPVSVSTFGGHAVTGKLVDAQYGEVLVVAATARVDNRATEVVGIGLSDARLRWRFACPDGNNLKLRFAGAPAGDDTAAGRLTLSGERASVVIDCGTRPVRLSPATGRQL